MIPTSTLIAVLVWLRASERISVTVLALLKRTPHGDRNETNNRERDQIRGHQSLRELSVRHDRCAQSFPARTVIPQAEGPRAAVALCHAADRRVRARRQSLFFKGSDGGSLTTLRQGAWGDVAS
jgi:hypothetical protein